MKSFVGPVSSAVWGSFAALLVAFILINILGGILEAIELNRDGDSSIGFLFMLLSFILSPLAAVWGGIRGARIDRQRNLLVAVRNKTNEVVAPE